MIGALYVVEAIGYVLILAGFALLVVTGSRR